MRAIIWGLALGILVIFGLVVEYETITKTLDPFIERIWRLRKLANL